MVRIRSCALLAELFFLRLHFPQYSLSKIEIYKGILLKCSRSNLAGIMMKSLPFTHLTVY